MKPKDSVKGSKNLDKFEFPIQGTHPALLESLKKKVQTPKRSMLPQVRVISESSRSQSQAKLLKTQTGDGAYTDEFGGHKNRGNLIQKKDR